MWAEPHVLEEGESFLIYMKAPHRPAKAKSSQNFPFPSPSSSSSQELLIIKHMLVFRVSAFLRDPT